MAVEPRASAFSWLTIWIVYELPRAGFWRIVGLLLARPYRRWCLPQMLHGARQALEAPVRVTA